MQLLFVQVRHIVRVLLTPNIKNTHFSILLEHNHRLTQKDFAKSHNFPTFANVPIKSVVLFVSTPTNMRTDFK